MRKHTKEFKNSISTFGRELDSKITVIGTNLVLGKEDLYSVKPITNATLLKTVMKEVDFESKQQIGIGQEINVKSGVKVGNEYEYVNYGNYSIYKSEYKAETDTYSHICYDKMLKTMIDYTPLDITYPINLREYINTIATKCGLEFADKNSKFANYNTAINEDHFSNGSYTFRDVLDYIAQLFGGWFCINDNDELEIRYPELAKNYDKVSGENVSFISNAEDEINTIIVDGKSTQETSTDPVKPSPDYPSEVECVKGKNLFDYTTNLQPSLNGITSVINEDGNILLSGLPTAVFTNFISFTTVKLQDKTTYTLSQNILPLNVGVRLELYGTDKTGTLKQLRMLDSLSYTFTTDYSTYTSYSLLGVILKRYWGTIDKSVIFKPQLEKGSVATNCVPYDTIQVKNIGKNLFNKDSNNIITNKYLSTAGKEISDSNFLISDYIKVIPNTNYSLQPYQQVSACVCFYDENKVFISSANLYSINPNTQTPNNCTYIRTSIVKNNLNIFQLEKGSVATDYAPYQSQVLNINLKGNELCSVGNAKDELIVKNGRAKIIKRIGKVILNGSESVWYAVSEGFYTPTSSWDNKSRSETLSNYFQTFTAYSGFKDASNGTGFLYPNVNNYYLKIDGITTVAELKNWLSTHNTTAYYVLATEEKIDLGEVDTLNTYNGVNNISLNASMNTNMSITYATDFEELDKHFLKNVNVSFTKKYGAINSVVFSRGGGTDNIYRKDNASINKNGLTEIKIADNPFLEGDDRENFIQQLFDKINGLEFYIMDVACTGIMYLELGDLYYFNMVEEKPSLKSGLVKSGLRKAQGSSGGKFLCLLMNNEVKITQGLEESIYTDEPEITETDYKTASITDTSIKNAIIQTNKNSAEILLKVNSNEVVSAINLSPEKVKISSAKLDVDAIATFTNSKLAEAGSTVINGANITTGSISCDRLSGGTISGQAISGGTITGSQINATSGNIGGFNIDGSSGFASDYGALRPNGNLLLYPDNAKARYVLSNAMTYNAQTGVVIASNCDANISAPATALDLKACYGADAYLGCMINKNGTGERSGITCSDGVLAFRSTGYCTYNGNTVFGSSSRATKENIKDLTKEQKEEVYELIKNIPTKQYDYKKEYGKPFNYGFIIEDIENTKLKELLHITQAENNSDIKMYSTEDLVRLELIVIQELMKKIDNLEQKVFILEKERECENNAKN